MEKRGELLNQLALISDLLEKINLEAEEKKLTFVVKKEEFDRIWDIIIKKSREKINKEIPESLSINIGDIEIIFSTNNV